MVRFAHISLLALALLASGFSQTSSPIDSVYRAFMTGCGASAERAPRDSAPIKCGVPHYAELAANLAKLTPDQRDALRAVAARPTLHTSIVSPSGRFRIHFDTSGVNAPAYADLDGRVLSVWESARAAAEAFDSAYRFEVEELGYLPPPSDDANGGDALFDVYLKTIGFYGLTYPDVELPEGGRHTTYIVIHNSFGSGFYSRGLEGLWVTAAHEFHHAIVIGGYGLVWDEIFYQEIACTAMEEFAHDEVNDYYNYMDLRDGYFAKPGVSIVRSTSGSGYDLAVWHIYLRDKYGYAVIKRIWEIFSEGTPTILAVDAALKEYGSSFRDDFNEFAAWTYFTGDRAVEGKYFEEGAAYEQISFTGPVMEPDEQFELSAIPASVNFLRFADPLSHDTLVAVVTAGDARAAHETPYAESAIAYGLYRYPVDGAIKINDYYYAAFDCADVSAWRTSEILNNQLVATGATTDVAVGSPYPNPYRYSDHFPQPLRIPFDADPPVFADFRVYTAAMEAVFSQSYEFPVVGDLFVSWRPVDFDGDALPTGVYFYVVKVGDETSTGKIVLIND
ncbi:MAG: hypothetical protein GF419_12330 [Ignavibacteriales bacterium]|nr:hypothetical protein [Ignavibacteriales bacterium]